MSELSEHELFQHAKHNDYTAFEEIVRRYQHRVYRLAYGMLHNPTEAEEITQETFLNVFRHLKNFRGESSPSSWLFKITINAALMRLRSQKRKPTTSLDQEAILQLPAKVGAWANQPEEQLLNKELAELIEQTILSLPEKYRVVLLLRDVEEQTNEEVAETLGISIGNVKSRLHRARLVVRQAVENYFDTGQTLKKSYSKG